MPCLLIFNANKSSDGLSFRLTKSQSWRARPMGTSCQASPSAANCRMRARAGLRGALCSRFGIIIRLSNVLKGSINLFRQLVNTLFTGGVPTEQPHKKYTKTRDGVLHTYVFTSLNACWSQLGKAFEKRQRMPLDQPCHTSKSNKARALTLMFKLTDVVYSRVGYGDGTRCSGMDVQSDLRFTMECMIDHCVCWSE